MLNCSSRISKSMLENENVFHRRLGKMNDRINSVLLTKGPSAFALSVARRSEIFSETTFAARPWEASTPSPSASSISSS